MRRFAMAALMAGSITACGGVSTQQEVQLGTDYASQINAELPIAQREGAYLVQIGNLAGEAQARALMANLRSIPGISMPVIQPR